MNNLDYKIVDKKFFSLDSGDSEGKVFETNKVDQGNGIQARPGRIWAGLKEIVSVPVFFIGMVGFILLGFAMICFDFLAGEHKKIKRIDIHT